MLTKTNETILTDIALTAVSYGGYLNGESFQQEGLITFNNYQYATFYNNKGHVCLSRRLLPEGEWRELEFNDYDVEKPYDAHNTISIGICPLDGTIHLSFDHHGSRLHYRVSKPGLALYEQTHVWETGSFGEVTDKIGGRYINNVTYPRFIITPRKNLLFEYRYGTSGDGDQILWQYNGLSGEWSMTGKYINGIEDNCNAYPHGLTYDYTGRLHLTWCWRESPDPSTNHDLLYAYSDDNGFTWCNNSGKIVARTGISFINKKSEGINVWSIEQNRGLINQEAQAVDSKGQIHVLLSHLPDEEKADVSFTDARKKCRYYHYWRNNNGKWQRNDIGISSMLNFRGKLAIFKNDNICVVLPDLRLAYATAADRWEQWLPICNDDRFFSDPLIDIYRMREKNQLSIFAAHEDGGKISVLDYIQD